jgi:hypothetical protein
MVQIFKLQKEEELVVVVMVDLEAVVTQIQELQIIQELVNLCIME